MFASLITLVHFATSDLMKASYSSGEVGEGSLLVARMRVRTSGVCRTSVVSLLRRMITGRGVPEAVTRPKDPSASQPGSPLSADVGMFGAIGVRSFCAM